MREYAEKREKQREIDPNWIDSCHGYKRMYKRICIVLLTRGEVGGVPTISLMAWSAERRDSLKKKIINDRAKCLLGRDHAE